MDWTLDKSRSICRQISEKICVAIASGEFSANDKIFSVREVALLASVTPNTVQKSFEELERCGVLRSVPYSGWYVNENIEAARKEVELLQKQSSEDYLASMARLGISADEALTYLTRHITNQKEQTYE